MTAFHSAAGALLARHLDENFASVLDEGVRRTVALPSYTAVPMEQLRPRVAAGFSAVLHDLTHPPDSRFGRVFESISEQRARQRFAIRDVCEVIQLTEQILEELAAERIADLEVRLPAVQTVHGVCVSARDAIISSFWKVNQELLQRAEALVSQLSSPLLPVADGVIVLPLLGMVDATRARQLLESLLNGIVSHRAAVAIIDITAITDVDGFAIAQLVKAAQAGRLLGAQIVFVGTSPDVARTIAQQQLDFSGIVTLTNLQAGLAYAQARLVKKNGPPRPLGAVAAAPTPALLDRPNRPARTTLPAETAAKNLLRRL